MKLKGVNMTVLKSTKLAIIATATLLGTITSANAHEVYERQKVNYERDYTAIIVYTAPNPQIHRVVQRKVIAAKRRQTRLNRRLIRASLRL